MSKTNSKQHKYHRHSNNTECYDFIDSVLNPHQQGTQIHHHHLSFRAHTSKGLTVKLIISIILTSIFFVAGIITGLLTGSLSLQSDAYHLLSDLASLITGLVANHLSKSKPTFLKTYGWARMEVVGALINSVFMLSICLTIVFDSVRRFITPASIEDPLLFTIVGTLGLLVNVVAIFLYADAENDNVKGMFAHALVDFFGSIAVLVSALVIQFTTWRYKDYIDPMMSLIIVALLVHGSVSSMLRTSQTLLQSTPNDVDLVSLNENLLNIDGLVAVHELHAWQLVNQGYVATAHIVVDKREQIKQIQSDSTNIFMKYQIFNTTIQVEFVDDFPTGSNHLDSCFYASSIGDIKRSFITPPVYQHGIGCPHVIYSDVGAEFHDETIETPIFSQPPNKDAQYLSLE